VIVAFLALSGGFRLFMDADLGSSAERASTLTRERHGE